MRILITKYKNRKNNLAVDLVTYDVFHSLILFTFIIKEKLLQSSFFLEIGRNYEKIKAFQDILAIYKR